MIVLALILAVATHQLVLVDETVDVRGSSVEAINVSLEQSGALIEVDFEAAGADSEIAVSLVGPGDGAFSRRGKPNQYLRMLAPRKAGSIRYPAALRGEYRVVLDNRQGGGRPQLVKLRVMLTFGGAGVTEPVTLPPGRKAAIVAISLLFFFSIAWWSGRRILTATRKRTSGEQTPLF